MSPLTLRRGAPTMTSHWAQHPSRLPGDGARAGHVRPRSPLAHHAHLPRRRLAHRGHAHPRHRSEERRVGKECRAQWTADDKIMQKKEDVLELQMTEYIKA